MNQLSNKIYYCFFLETIRLYPDLPFLDRLCVLPKDQKEYSLKPFGDYVMPNGMPIIIPVYALQTDPKVQCV